MAPTASQDNIPLLNRLSTTILMGFLLLFLIPMGVIMGLSDSTIHTTAFTDAQKALKSVAMERKDRIETFFNRMVTDLKIQAKNQKNIQFMSALSRGLQSSGRTAPDYTQSLQWKKTVTTYSQDINAFMKIRGYYDIFFIDTLGNILYTVTRENDLGTNLFQSQTLHKGSLFSKVAAEVMASGTPMVTDFDRYPYSRQGIFGFMIAPVKNFRGTTIGLMAFQYPITRLNQISRGEAALGKSMEVYLVGSNMTLRSKPKLNPELKILDTPVPTLSANLWKKSLTEDGSSRQPTDVYLGLHGNEVLGIHETITFLNMSFGVISEIAKEEAFASMTEYRTRTVFLFLLMALAVAGFALLLSNRIVSPLEKLSRIARKVSQGDYAQSVDLNYKNEIGHLGRVLNEMIQALDQAREQSRYQAWITKGQNQVISRLQGDWGLDELCNQAIAQLCQYLNAQVGVLYLEDGDGHLQCRGRHAVPSQHPPKARLAPGDGLVGQTYIEGRPKILTKLPANYLPLSSGLGEISPVNLILFPFINDGEVIAVAELAGMGEFGEEEMDFLNSVTNNICRAVLTIKSREHEQNLLRQIKTQHEELKASNEELEEQTVHLKNSQDELQRQSEELRTTNEDLKEKTQRLSQQQAELEESRQELALRATKLSEASQYKSEFLANMSHELRSPLNSLLILAQTLAENPERNLNPGQVKSSKIIYNSGRELLTMINDILDLSKIEAGRMDAHLEPVALAPFLSSIRDKYESQSRDKGLSLVLETDPAAPKTLVTDMRLLRQILNNFMSNAVKFTQTGTITLKAHTRVENDGTIQAAFSVVDTGIGIPKDKQECIFDAFTQADGTTTRKFGGTGLGLSISKQLASLIKGDILLESAPGRGTTFTLVVPLDQALPAPQPKISPPKDADQKQLIIIEDDPHFSDVVRTMAEEKGYHVHLCSTGTQGLTLALEQPPAGIILDLTLPDMEGKEILDALKKRKETADIPVHVISGRDEMEECLEKGAVGFLLKPAGREEIHAALDKLSGILENDTGTILLVEDDEVHQEQIRKLIESQDIQVNVKGTGAQAIQALENEKFDCVVLDLTLPDMDGLDVLSTLAQANPEQELPPVLIYTAKDLTRREMNKLLQYARKVIPKGPDGVQRLKDEVSLFLNTMESRPSPQTPRPSAKARDEQVTFKDKSVLLVDDDMRNVYAMSGLLQRAGMRVTMAENGVEALKSIEASRFDLVLMDIMMPEMDGYQATREIRKQPHLKDLPIIALTAKAMPEDREKCLAAGVNDYLAKPVDRDKLFSILKVWLYTA